MTTDDTTTATPLGEILAKLAQKRGTLATLPLEELEADLVALKDAKDELEEMLDTLGRAITKCTDVVEDVRFGRMMRGAEGEASPSEAS